MNAQRLLAAFSRIGDDPDRIQQLRKIAVALAISGKLDNGATSMPPSEVLEAVNRVKAALAKRGEIPKPKRREVATAEQLPANFTDPTKFAPLGELARIEKGLTGIQQAQPGEYPLVVTSAERSACDHFDFDGAAAIIPLVSSTGHGNASINRLHYQEGKFALGTILVAAFPYDPALISARFLFEYLSAFKEELLVSRMTGTANVTLSVGRVAEVPVPLISPEVQRKVDELMALCDRLEAAQTGREAVRDRLTTASLTRLTAPETDAETFPAYASFALQTLPTLTTRPDQIKTLRQTILNLAVRGKLVEQDPTDEPASVLLERIVRERNTATKAKKVRRSGNQDLVSLSAESHLPHKWVWTDLDQIALSMRYGTSIKCEHATKGVPVLRIPNVSGGTVSLGDMKYGPLSASEIDALALRAGDILMIRSNGSLDIVGRSAVVPAEAEGMAFGGYLVRLRLSQSLINATYIWFVLNSSYIREQIEKPIRSAVGLKNINLTEFGNLTIPLPPLAEQHRIVAKVYALMRLCDHLEASLATTTTTRCKLLNALLHEALEPAAAPVSEAAE